MKTCPCCGADRCLASAYEEFECGTLAADGCVVHQGRQCLARQNERLVTELRDVCECVAVNLRAAQPYEGTLVGVRYVESALKYVECVQEEYGF